MPVPSDLQNRPIRAVVTAGTALAAGQLARDLAGDPSLAIGFAASTPNLWQQIETARPMVVLLDTLLAGEKTPQLVHDLIDRAKLPVLIRAKTNENSPAMLLDCIDAGALAILNRPVSADHAALAIPSLIWRLKTAAGASLVNLARLGRIEWTPARESKAASIIAIGAGMGGVPALGKMLGQIPASSPGVVAVAPLPAELIAAWIDRIKPGCQVRIRQACDGGTLQQGQVLIAPGDRHLLVRGNGWEWTTQIKDGPAVFYQKPSVEVLFNSVAAAAGPKAVGVLLGGAGVDGVTGLLQLRKSGGRSLTESPDTSVFAELPRRALQCGAAETSAPANELVNKMLEFAAAQQIPQAA